VLPAAFGPGARRPGTCPPLPPLRSGRGAPSGSPRPRAGRGLRLSRYAAGRVGSRPALFSRAGGLRAARPLAARAATPTRRPPRRRSGPPGVRGSRSLRPGPAVPSTVDALPLCPLLPGWPPGGRSAPGSRCPRSARLPPALSAAALRAGGPARCGGGHRPPGAALPPRAGARPPVSVFLLPVPLPPLGRGPAYKKRTKNSENWRKTAKIVEKTVCYRYNECG
jgi:hypothetical protein